MKKSSIFLLLFLVSIVTLEGQTEDNDYNIRGDEAMKELDYIKAKLFYEEGVYAICDPYSIEKIMTIWSDADSLRPDMNSVIKQCFNCLEEKAKNYRDTSSMHLLVYYYSEGIGTEPNKGMADSWEQRLEEIRNPFQRPTIQNGAKTPREKAKMQFFAGYAATFEAPFGLTAGGVGRTIGWYLRFRSNLSFMGYAEKWDGTENISGFTGNWNDALPKSLDIKSSKTLIGTGGIVIKASPSFYLSLGAGYCSREDLYKFEKIGIVEPRQQGTFWVKYTGETSFNGVALDLDGAFKIGKTWYGSLGCTMLDFKYLSANAGVGVFFKTRK